MSSPRSGFEAAAVLRTTFSYDIIIHRLNRDIDIVKEWQGYQRSAPRRRAHA